MTIRCHHRLSVSKIKFYISVLPLTFLCLGEDYAEIGLGEEEGDYSTPAARNYELDRTQIGLNEIIGIGQFGDVHIGTCRVKQKSSTQQQSQHKDDSSLEEEGATNGDNNNEGKLGIIHVAVKTCKADADMTTSEKFLEEACKLGVFLTYTKSENAISFHNRYNAKVRASAYHSFDWHLQFIANMDCYGISQIW